jgi:hypothetical protein
MNAMGGARSQKTQFGCGVVFFAHFVAPTAWYPFGQGPQLAFPALFVVHVRCEEQPPLFFLHGSSFSHFVAPRAWYPCGQGPHDFLPFENWHVRCEEQPPLLLKHGLVVVVVVVGVQIP